MLNKQTGLTLIELLVTVAVVVTLASVAYPLYTEQAQKSRRADAKATLQLIQLAQERYYSANSEYAVSPSSLSVPGATLGSTSDQGYYNVQITGGDQTYVATVTPTTSGAQASDTDCTSFSINQLGVRSATGSDSGSCW